METEQTPQTPGTLETPEVNQVTLDPEKFAELSKNADAGKEASVAAEAAKSEAADLKVLLGGDPKSDAWGEAFVRQAMSNGHSQAAALQQLQEARAPEEPEKVETPKEASNEELEKIRSEFEAMKAQQREANTKRVRERFDAGVASALKSDETLNKIIESKGEDGLKAVRSAVAEKARGIIQKRLELETRRAGREVWEDSWLDEALEQATNSVSESYRLVIGDANPLGRVPETITEIEAMAKVDVPDGGWKPGMSTADVMAANEAQIKAELAKEVLNQQAQI